MTTSIYMPDVKVEIAFNAGYTTPAASRTWTDVSSYVELDDKIDISHGRADEFGTTDPNKLTLTLDNRDGRFTADRAASPYFPNVKIGRPIKVTATPVGGAASIRFLGYIDEWPVEWPGSDSYAMTKITATSRMARMGFGAELLSTVAEEFIRNGSTTRHYWPLNEPNGATTAADATGSANLFPAEGTPEFGGATGLPDGSTGFVQKAGENSALTTGTLAVKPNPLDPEGIVLEAFVLAQDTVVDADIVFASEIGVAQSAFFSIQISGGRPQAHVGLSIGGLIAHVTVTGSNSVADGRPHHIAGTIKDTGTNYLLGLYVDGVSVGTTTSAYPDFGRLLPNQLFVGRSSHDDVVISHVSEGASLAGLASRAEAGLTGYTSDTAADRIERYAGYIAIAPAEIVADTDTHPAPAISTAGKTVLQAMRIVEQAEDGVLFDGRDNTLQFRSRSARYNRSAAFTLSAALQQIEAGLAPKMDRTSLLNDITITATDGSVARVVDQPSIDDYGYARLSLDAGRFYDEAWQAGSWRLLTHAEPQARIPSLGVSLLPLSAALQASILAADVGTKFALSGLPAQASASSLEFFVEGYTESIGTETYEFDFNVSPAAGYDLIFILDDPVRGVLDSSYRLAY